MLHCPSVHYIVLQFTQVCLILLQCIPICYSVLQYTPVFTEMLNIILQCKKCAAVYYYRVIRFTALYSLRHNGLVEQSTTVCYSVLHLLYSVLFGSKATNSLLQSGFAQSSGKLLEIANVDKISWKVLEIVEKRPGGP